MRVGIEIGGTFTDLIATDGLEVRTAKVPSVPRRPEEGAFNALESAGISVDRITDLIHGSTVATNAVLERKGGLTALVLTEGFRDLMIIQRQDRPSIYRLDYQKPAAVVGRSDICEIGERVLADGSVAQALDEAKAEAALIDFLSRKCYDAIAICLLNAYANPSHEQALAAIIKRHFPNLHVNCSSDISREFREYERASTTVLSAYVHPVIDTYLQRFENRLADGGFAGRFSIMQSNGGRLPTDAIRRNAITTLYSGPAAGVTGAIHQTGLSRYRNLITFDMGGTSTDVCVVTDAQPGIAPETVIDGLPIRTPVIDIATVGAGGGSIVWRDAGGMLRVGPQSSAADPGPACYGRGGTQPTITDAHLIRGTLQSETFLGGRMALDFDAACKVFQPLADAFSMSLEEIADSAIRIADGNVVRAIQLISTELGRDPRDYVLVPFGGAGPLHAGRIAEDLGMSRIVVPRNAGILSAFGLLASEFKQFETVTSKIGMDADTAANVRSVFAGMEAEMKQRFARYGITEDCEFLRALQMRFVGQAFEVEVTLSDDEFDAMTTDSIMQNFVEAYQQVYSHKGGSIASSKVEIVGFRLGGTVAQERISLPPPTDAAQGDGKEKRIFEHGHALSCQLIGRAAINSAAGLSGPALVNDGSSTTFILSGWRAHGDAAGNLVIEQGDGA